MLKNFNFSSSLLQNLAQMRLLKTLKLKWITWTFWSNFFGWDHQKIFLVNLWKLFPWFAEYLHSNLRFIWKNPSTVWSLLKTDRLFFIKDREREREREGHVNLNTFNYMLKRQDEKFSLTNQRRNIELKTT